MVKKVNIDTNKLQKLQELGAAGINPYPYTYNQSHHAKNVNETYSSLQNAEHTDVTVSVAGRIMLKRVMGKASFFHIEDQTGRIQIYLTQDNLGNSYDLLTKKTDLGDIIGIEGHVFKTKLGEVTVEAKSAVILCKSLIVLPEKYHGIKDIELKYRQRYLDLIMNPETRQVFEKRSLMIKSIRDFFAEKGFMEVETPTLQTVYGGANAKPFVTHINAWEMKMFLSISPELFLKRLLVGGFEKVFTICKNFRNEDVDTTHNPEFTMLEIYQSYVDYNTMMEYLEQVYEKACIALHGTTTIKRIHKGQEVELNFKAPWKRLTIIDAIKKYASIDVTKISEKALKNLVDDKNLEYDVPFSWGLGVQLLFEEFVEEHLIQPVHIIDHPKESTPLCKPCRYDPRLIERFESFCLGMEISNAYSELNDPILQRKLLEEQAQQLRAGSSEAHPMDEDFVNAMEYGMPPAGGLGFGIDRMAIILTQQESIRDVILFPTVKPVVDEEEEKIREMKSAIVLINKGLNKQPWQELNTVAHLNASFAARKGKELFLQESITTKDHKQIKLNIQHAIMIKEAKNSQEIAVIINKAKAQDIEIAEFTKEMQETTNDKKVIAITKEKNYADIEYLGCLIFGKKSLVDDLTKQFPLHK